MPDPTDVQPYPHDEDLVDVARDDPRGLKILDMVEVGGTWVVAAGNSGQAEPAPAKPVPEPGGLLTRRGWAMAGGLTLLVVALAALVPVPMTAQPRSGSPQAPAAVVPSRPASPEATAVPSPSETPPGALPSPQAVVPASPPTPARTPVPTPTRSGPTPTPTPTDQPTPTPTPTPDFTLAVTPDTQSVPVGGSTTYAISAAAVGGFSGSIGLSVTDLPPGVTASFDVTSVDPGSSATLSVLVDATAAPGTYALTVAGASGSLTHSQTVTLTVT